MARYRSADTYGSYAITCMPNASARCATSWPIRPKPRIPSVFSYSSTPENFERSHLPLFSEACACGTLRASARSSAIVCSAAVITFDWGALATTIPRFVAAATSTLSTPTPARPTARSRVRLVDHLGVKLRRRADENALVARDALGQLVPAPANPEFDVEVLAEEVDSGIADLLGDENLHDVLQDVVDAARQRRDVARRGRREHRDAELVAAELAVRLDVDDPIGAQRRRERSGIDVIIEIDRADDLGALRRVDHERRRPRMLLGPVVQRAG